MSSNLEYYMQRLDQSGVPLQLREGLAWYVVHGRPTGSFLEACIAGDLFDACARADIINRPHLFTVAYFLVNYAPVGCYGTREAYRDWIERKGIAGVTAEAMFQHKPREAQP